MSKPSNVQTRADKYAKDREDRFDTELEKNIRLQKVEKDKSYLSTSGYDPDDEYSTLSVSEEEQKKYDMKGKSSEQLLRERKRFV